MCKELSENENEYGSTLKIQIGHERIDFKLVLAMSLSIWLMWNRDKKKAVVEKRYNRSLAFGHIPLGHTTDM